MIINEMVYVGIEISSASRPFIFAALDQNLNVLLLERCGVSDSRKHLKQHENVMLAVNVSFRNQAFSNGNKHKIFNGLEKEITQAGYKPYLSNHACRQWVETYPFECCNALMKETPLPRHSFRGRVQRAAMLSEQGLQINGVHDSADMTGATLYTPKELDALIAASIAWMLINKPVNIDLTREPDKQMISIPREDKDWWRKKPVSLK